ncbi:DUF6907 domain-containing protein [Streptacidiphilus anmyonensis]|uniref:DUF6907 domain-containing protein n=1 Tax=Streptacidiphilus anmyonensis TaxID=405782 RepID=UPI0005A92D36|nr:hypothetical protein [Streptacidiphilus anmyonensis]
MSPRLWKRRPKTVTVPLWRGGRMTIPEPAWCNQQHEPYPLHPVDVRHVGIEIPLPVHAGGKAFEILAFSVVQDPYSSVDFLPRANVDLGDDYGTFTHAELYELADGLVEHAGRLREFADDVERTRQAVADATRPAGMPADWPWPPDRDADQQ